MSAAIGRCSGTELRAVLKAVCVVFQGSPPGSVPRALPAAVLRARTAAVLCRPMSVVCNRGLLSGGVQGARLSSSRAPDLRRGAEGGNLVRGQTRQGGVLGCAISAVVSAEMSVV